MSTATRTLSPASLLVVVAWAGVLAWGNTAEAQNKTWAGTTNGTWTTGTNWSPSGAPGTGNATVFDGTGSNLNTTTTAPFTVQSLTFTAAQSSPVTINTTTTNFLRLSSTSPLFADGGNHIISGNGTAASGAAWDFSFDGADSTARTISIAGNASLDIQSRVSNTNGAGVNFNRSLAKTGNGTLILSGINNGTGAWQFFGGNTFSINQGVVRLANAGSYGNGQNAYVVASGAALELSSGFSQNLIFGGSSNGTVTLNGTGIGSNGALRSLSGSNTLTGNSSLGIGLAANSSIGVDGGHLFLNVPITMNGTGSRSLTKVGAGKLTLNGTSSYNGTTTIAAGTLQLARAVALYNNTPGNWTASNVRVNAGTLALNVGGTGEFSTGNVTSLLTNLGGSNGTNTEGFAAGSTIGFDTTNASGGNFTVNDVIADSTGSGGGAVGMAKLGANRLILTGSNTYTGPTTVEAGTLAINGALGATSVTVSSGARLQGSGSIGGPVTILGDGMLATGNSIESLATGAIALSANSTFAYEIDNDATPGVAGDLTAVTGNLSLDLGNASLLTIADLGSGSWAIGDKLTLISYDGAWNGGLFTYNGTTLADDSTFTFSGIDWLFNYDDASAGTNFTGDLTGPPYVTMTAVPEPATVVLLAGSLAILALRRFRGTRRFGKE